MPRPIIFLTQTSLNLEKIDQMLAYNFIHNPKNLTTFWKESSGLNFDDLQTKLDDNWRQCQATGRVIASETYKKSLKGSLGVKEKFDEELPSFYRQFNEPTLLLLGNLEVYDVSLQDAMLKLLEEPSPNLQIVLYYQNQADLITTIQSRAIMVNLPSQFIINNLDPKILKDVAKLFPKAGDFAKEMLNAKLSQNSTLSYPYHKDMEREPIDCWLWQVGVCLEEFYKQSQDNRVAVQLQKVVTARKYNNQNMLKKLVLSSLAV